MQLWKTWWAMVNTLRPAFSRFQTFIWFSLSLAGMTVRCDIAGVTSIIRALGLKSLCYKSLLNMFHSSSVNLSLLTTLWTSLVIHSCKVFLIRVNNRIVLVGDGIKVPKSGKKMPAVKKLFQASESSTKPRYIRGHSCQSVAILAGTARSVFAILLACRIHEGVIFSNRDATTLLDKMLFLVDELAVSMPYYFVADAYYACRKMIAGILKAQNHLISRVKSNAVAYESPSSDCPVAGKKGAKKKYGKKIYLRTLLDDPDQMLSILSPLYGETSVSIRVRSCDLLWRPAGIAVRFVAVRHPYRGQMILMSTDPSLAPVEIIRLYGLRFKIEVSFKQTLHTLGTYCYHFWMKSMRALSRNSGDQYLHHASEEYRRNIRRKLSAYHNHIQTGIIAQGLLQYLSLSSPERVFSLFGSWIRTVRKGVCPSEQVTAIAMRNTLPEFLADSPNNAILAEFIKDNIDLCRTEGLKLVA